MEITIVYTMGTNLIPKKYVLIVNFNERAWPEIYLGMFFYLFLCLFGPIENLIKYANTLYLQST